MYKKQNNPSEGNLSDQNATEPQATSPQGEQGNDTRWYDELYAEEVDEDVPMTAREKERFENHYATLVSACQSIAAAGVALEDIRNNHLYRETHSSFEALLDEFPQMEEESA